MKLDIAQEVLHHAQARHEHHRLSLKQALAALPIRHASLKRHSPHDATKLGTRPPIKPRHSPFFTLKETSLWTTLRPNAF
jgi:hypothetical protein